MRKNEKKIKRVTTKELRFMIEDFLEREYATVSKVIESRTGEAKKLWDQLTAILFKDTHWMDEVDEEDLVGIDYEKLILQYHSFLKPVWGQFKENLFDYKERIVPQREATTTLRKELETDKSSPLSQFKELLGQDTVIEREQFYDITVTVSFDPGHVTFYKRSFNVLKNFMDLLSDVDIFYFEKCEHCGKCIILTRSDKRFCQGCAAKKYQHDKRQEDPEGFKQKEKERYQSKRKK